MKISQVQLLLVFKKTNGFCFYCPAWGEEVDHLVSKQEWKDGNYALFMGDMGVNDISNLFLACKKCNKAKNKQDALVFLQAKHGPKFDFLKFDHRVMRANRRAGIEGTSYQETPDRTGPENRAIRNKLPLPLPPFPDWLREFHAGQKFAY